MTFWGVTVGFKGFQKRSGSFLGCFRCVPGVFMGLQGCYSEFQGSSSEIHSVSGDPIDVPAV